MANQTWANARGTEAMPSWSHYDSLPNDDHRASYNALGLIDIDASGTSNTPALDINDQPVITKRRRSPDQTQFRSPIFRAVEQPSQDSIFSFYLHGQDPTHPTHTNTLQTFADNGTTAISQPIYFLPGNACAPSSRHTPYIGNAETPPSAFPTYVQHGTIFHTAFEESGYNHMPMQTLRPVSSSSSESPDEMLMTPYILQGSQSLNTTPYLSYIPIETAFAQSSMPLAMPVSLPTLHQSKGTDEIHESSFYRPYIASMQTTYDPHFTEVRGPVEDRPAPPPLTRRHTDVLPFSEGPLKRPMGGSAKPYDSFSERMRRPSSTIENPVNSLGLDFLSLHNGYVAKQRIACQGCREKKLKCTGATPVCYNCSKKGRTRCEYATTVRRRGPGKKRLAAEARAAEEGYYADTAPGIPAQYAFWAHGGDGQS